MFLGVYRFDGDVEQLQRGYKRLLEQVPTEALHLHVCVRDDGGLSVYDACPTREGFETFSGSAEFRSAVAAAGLPAPRVSPLGDVHAAFFSGKRAAIGTS